MKNRLDCVQISLLGHLGRYELDLYSQVFEKSDGTTELHYGSRKREHSLNILKAAFVRHSSEYERSDNDISYSDECRTHKAFNMLKECSSFFNL